MASAQAAKTTGTAATAQHCRYSLGHTYSTATAATAPTVVPAMVSTTATLPRAAPADL